MNLTKCLRLGGVLLFGAAFANAGVTYTCDPNVTAVSATICTTLNSTIAGLYNNTFSNVNASIYVMFGSTDLGMSQGYLNFVSYNQYVTAVSAKATASGNPVLTAAVTALNNYAKTIYGNGNGQVELSTALARSLGFTNSANEIVGTKSDGNNYCNNIGASGCYDGIITITNDASADLYYRTGTEKADGYDFYGIVEHETDEILGTSSCISTGPPSLTNGCAGQGQPATPAAVDLFRYSGTGKLASVFSLSTTPGAYFSYDGGVTNGTSGTNGKAVFYNTLADGDDYADFLGNCPSVQHIQDAEGCPGKDAGLDITNDGGAEINILNALGYTLTPLLPVISSAGVVAHGSKSTTIEAGSWVDIYGTNLAQASGPWNAAAIKTNLPTSLDGVTVSIDGNLAYVNYITPGQINVLAPDDAKRGTVNVTVTNSVGTSSSVTATLADVGPSFFTQASDYKYVAGVIPTPNGTGFYGAYDLLGPSGQYSFNTRPVKIGETVELYATGFGQSNPPVPIGVVYNGASQTMYQVNLLIGNVSQTVTAYIVGAGLWQMNVTIPPNVVSGDNTLEATVDGVQAPTVYITVQ